MDAVREPQDAVLIYQDRRTRVTRESLPEGSVVRKEPLGPGREERLQHERMILQRLAGVPGVIQLAEPEQAGTVTLEDVEGAPLAEVPTPSPPAEIVRLGLELARTVAAVHHRGVVHRNLSPASVLVVEPRLTPVLIDFGRATAFAEVRPEFAHPAEIMGAMPYLAPEQTGRTGRPVDQRADLYSLGAILYERATGTTPFDATDLLRLSHDHLTRVPTRPDELRPTLPAGLSAVIMHLLETEPDERYQTADGLAHDLDRLRQADPEQDGRFQVGQRDFPLRLRSPSRLVGRDREIAALGEALAGANTGRCRAVLISGAAGAGKSALVDQLRPLATASNGWFVAGKFDQHRRDQDFDAVRQAFRGLARLLLAEPDAELRTLRHRLRDAVGDNASLQAAAVPEFATVLDIPAATTLGDPLTAEPRLVRAAVEALRVIASPKRPVVLVVDDLQWASRTPLSFVDAVINDPDLDGLLLVGTYREDEVDATHPLAAMISRWQHDQRGVEHVRAANLPPAALTAMLADMLRLDPDRAGELVRIIAPYTHGNPYHTVELLTSLRHQAILVPGATGWRWDPDALRRHLGRTGVAALLAERAEALPPETGALLRAMACLGGRVDLATLGAAVELPPAAVADQLTPALEDGLLLLDGTGQSAVQFRHDRVQEAILGRLGYEQRQALRLRLARALSRAPADHPDLAVLAADQYLPVVAAVREPPERRRVAGLLREAASQAKLLSNHDLVESCLAAALPLLTDADPATLIDIQTDRHTALFSLGRLAEADEVYQEVLRLSTGPIERTPATLVQISSLTNRHRTHEAVELGLDLLRQLGCETPTAEQLGPETERGLDELFRWVAADEPDDLSRPAIQDQDLLRIAAVINRMLPPAYLGGHPAMAWLCLTAWRMWVTHGPGRTLVGPVAHLQFVAMGARGDIRTGYQAARRFLAVSQAHDFQPDTSQAMFLYALGSSWFEPLEDGVQQAQAAREGLIHGGDLQNACYTYYVTAYALFECAPTLDVFLPEVESGLAFAGRIGNDQAVESYDIYQRLTRFLRGDDREELAAPESYPHNPQAQLQAHISRALVATLFDDIAALARHSAAAMALQWSVVGTYATAVVHLLRALSLAHQVRAAAAGQRAELQAELDATIDWIADRATGAPANFEHLLRLVEAERAWAAGDFPAATLAFDAAQQAAATRQRPWHRALILERGARFSLAHGLAHTGQLLLAEARQAYGDWGAKAKVDQLGWAYPALPEQQPQSDGRPAVMTGTIDLVGILSASQVLSSETSIDGVRARVVEVLGAMTGATAVHLLLWDTDGERWLTGQPDAGGDAVPIDAGELPVSAIRYVERTREPLVVDDATRDDRFARDPYVATLERCSLLVAPVLSQGRLRAMLVLENRLIRSAFASDRLTGVMMIAGQLAVSLGNALVYASLERRVAERTEDLALANEKLTALSITDALTGLANRRRLEEVLSAEWLRSRRTGAPTSLAMIDIDRFKAYNDHSGHAAGDRCLQQVASLLRHGVRKADLVARYGGEEFVVVMPATDLGAAVEVAERLRTSVAAWGNQEVGNQAGRQEVGAPEQAVTVSIGVATMTYAPQVLVEHLIEQADAELYRAKHGGRNQVRPATDRRPRTDPAAGWGRAGDLR